MLRWGLIGCGDIAHRMVAPALRTAAGSELLAIARADVSRLAAFASAHGVKRTYPHWRDLVADADLNAVYIATPPDVHCVQDGRRSGSGQARAVREADGAWCRRVSADDRRVPGAPHHTRHRDYRGFFLSSGACRRFCHRVRSDAR